MNLNMLLVILYLIVIFLILGVVLYYFMGLIKGVDCFVYFVINLCMCMFLVESMMMIIVVIVLDFLMGMMVGVGV